MIVSARDLIIYVNLFMAVILYFLNILNPLGCALYALLTSLLLVLNIAKGDRMRITYSTALLLYTIATQFGLVIPYLFFGREAFQTYSDYTLRFMQSEYLSCAILLGIIAVTSMRTGTLFARRKYLLKNVIIDEAKENNRVSNRMYIVGILFLLIVALYFCYHILTGNVSLFSTYESYRQSAAYNSGIYSYVIIMFYVGTIYLSSAGRISEHKIGWCLWLLIAIVFALNGNKGEFLYAMLAVVGMKGVEGRRVSWKMSILFTVVLFFVIPSITSLRNIGILANLSSARLGLFDAFGEMGMQLRMSVYTLQDLAEGQYGYLYGRSYIQPIFNIITPFFSHSQATATVRSMYPGHGYSQVIESYLNFRIIGVVGYFAVVGWFVGKYEVLVTDKVHLAYMGTIVCVLINATRNYFAFVPGHILLITVVFVLVKHIKV